MKERCLEGVWKFAEREVLCFRVSYPLLEEGDAPGWEKELSAFYARQARQSLAQLKRRWYPLACESCRRRGEGFVPVTVSREFMVMYQGEDFFSAFQDTYCYQGRKELERSRESQTFSLKKRVRLRLGDLFSPGFPYRQILLDGVRRQIFIASQEDPEAFYVDYPSLLSARFQRENFYLADEGIVIYYRQRALGPSFTGTPSFLIPYRSFGSGLIPEL